MHNPAMSAMLSMAILVSIFKPTIETPCPSQLLYNSQG